MRAENNTSKGERRGLNYNLSDWHGALWCSSRGSEICVIFGNNACGGA